MSTLTFDETKPVTVKIGGNKSAWQAELTDLEQMPDGTLVASGIKLAGDERTPYYGLLIPALSLEKVTGAVVETGTTLVLFEKTKTENGEAKCGDVVAVFRRLNKKGARWHLETENEIMYREDGTSEVVLRLSRSSVVNVQQALKKGEVVTTSGWIRANARRIGSRADIRTSFAIAGWNFQNPQGSTDVREFVLESRDSLGIAAIFLALAKMPEDSAAMQIFMQIRHS